MAYFKLVYRQIANLVIIIEWLPLVGDVKKALRVFIPKLGIALPLC